MNHRSILSVLVGAAIMCQLVSANCDLAMLPTDLDLITAVEANAFREVHLHGMYRVGEIDAWDPSRDALVHNLTLKYTEDADFRISLLPHSAAWMKVELLDTSRSADEGGPKRVAHSAHGGKYIEHMIFHKLVADTPYKVMIQYGMGFDVADECPSTMMELAVQPTGLASILTGDQCDGKTETPSDLPKTIRPRKDEDKGEYYFSYSNNHPAFAQMGKDSSHTRFNQIGEPVAIKVPHIPGRHQQWKLRVVIFSRFLDGGDIAGIVTTNDVSELPHKNIQRDCKGCLYGKRGTRNEFIIQEQVWAGEGGQDGLYKFWLVLRRAEKSFGRNCAPYTLKITLHPLQQQETFSNCEYNPLPPSMHLPGLYDNRTGMLSWRDHVLVNLTQREQTTTIVPKMDSLLRVWVSHHKSLDIDLELRREDQPSTLLAGSLKMEGPEGIVYQVEKSIPYHLTVNIPYPHHRYDGLDHDYYTFCDSFQIHVHSFPLLANEEQNNDEDDQDDTWGDNDSSPPSASVDDNSACGDLPPDLEGLQSKLNDSQRIHWSPHDTNVYPYHNSFTGSDDMQTKILWKWDFYLPVTTVFSLLINSDDYGGRVHTRVSVRGASAEHLYSEQRGLGTSLFAELGQGWYTLEVLSPYLQTVASRNIGQVLPKMPKCMRYNFHLRIAPFVSEVQAGNCMFPIPMPKDMYLGAHGHRHFTESYSIPRDGISRMKVFPKEDSVLHFRVLSTTVPLSMSLVHVTSSDSDDDQDSVLAKSHDKFSNGHGAMMYTLTGGREYTVIFNYDMAEAAQQTCQELQLHQSVARIPPGGHFQECKSDGESYKTSPPGAVTTFKLPDHYELSVGPTIDKLLFPKHGDTTDMTILEVPRTMNFRFSLDYSFLDHDYTIGLCSCTDAKTCEGPCVYGNPTHTGVELHYNLMPPGNYSLTSYSWSHGLGHDKADYTRHCTLGAMRIAVSTADSKPAPPLCGNMFQYLPSSLNNPSDLYSGYHAEMHYQGSVLASTQHLKDTVQFSLKSESVFRAFVPRNPLPIALSVTHASDSEGTNKLGWTMGPDQAIYLKLAAGTYNFNVKYYLEESQRQVDQCLTYPLEFSIMEVKHLEKMVPSAKKDSCSSDPFPTTPMHHGHTTLYRPVGPPFEHVIEFSIGDLGGALAYDVRYLFYTSGLAVSLAGYLPSSSDPNRPTYIPAHRYSDRVYFDQKLLPGRYKLTVWDPVREYPEGTALNCAPYNIHIYGIDRGNASDPSTPTPNPDYPSPDPGDPPITESPNEAPTDLDCPGWSYEYLPVKNATDEDSEDKRFEIRKDHIKIPFESGVDQSSSFQGKEYHYRKATSSVGFYAKEGQYIRLWVRSPANNMMRVYLFYSGAQDPVARGQKFGFHTSSLVYRAHKSGYVRVEVQFHYEDEPKYGFSFNTCHEKFAQTSFAFFLSAFDGEVVDDISKCPSQNSNDAQNYVHHPPKEITVDSPISKNQQFYFDTDDFKDPRQISWSNVPDHNRGSHSDRGGRLHRQRTPHFLINRETSTTNSTIIVPDGTSPARLEVQIEYSLYLSNMRLSLHADNQSAPLARSDGEPMEADNERYNGKAMLFIQGLNSGVKYTLKISEHNAENSLNKNEDYCIKYRLRYRITADSYSDTTSAPDVSKPHIRDILPIESKLVDPTQHFRITLLLSEPAAKSFVAKESGDDGYNPDTLGRLLSLSHGSETHVSTVSYFLSDTEVVASFRKNSLAWNKPYTLNVEPAMLKTADHKRHFSIGEGLHQRTYHTAACACDDEGFCKVGGLCSCTLADGVTCNKCGPGSYLNTDENGHKVCFLGATSAPGTLAPAHWSGSKDYATPNPGGGDDGEPTESPDDDGGFTFAPPAHNPWTSNPTDNSGGKSSDGNKVSDPTQAPRSSGSGKADVDVEKPALRPLRVFLAAAVCLLIYMYAINICWTHKRGRGGIGGNPFRRGNQGGSPRIVASADDDDEENEAIVN